MTRATKDRTNFRSRIPMVIGFGTVILLFGGFGAWAARAKIDGAVLATGRIVVEQNRQVVQHQNGGLVDEVMVREGDYVEKDAVLIRLSPEILASELKVLEGQLFEIIARRGRLEAERDGADEIVFDALLTEGAATDPAFASLADGQQRLFEARRDTMEKAIVQLQNQRLQLQEQIAGIDAQSEGARQQLELIEKEVADQQKLLDKGLAQSSRVSALRRENARLLGTIGDLKSRRAQARERIAALEIEELQFQAGRREEAISILRDLYYNEMEMMERRQTLKRQLERMEIRAPVAGVVYNQRVFGSGSVIRPADPILYLVPQDRPLVIEAQVDPMHVNKVFAQQDVLLRFPAFDMRETPDLFGKVMQVSPDSFSDEQTGGTYYRIEIVLPKSEISKLGDGQTLVPGMPVDTFIRTGEHTPVQYLTEPITKYFAKAMRDGS
ncbi:MAG: HlyD family type I secretion periplasmic adaptor subunit [Roseovarius sp.]